MARKLEPFEFYQKLCKYTKKYDETELKYICGNIVEFIIDELKAYGEISFPSLGQFKSKMCGGKDIIIPNNKRDKKRLNTEEKFRKEYVEPFQKVTFYPSDSFKNVMNDISVTRSVWKRAREEIKKINEKEKILKKEKEILEKQQNAMTIAREKKLEKIRKQKEFEKLSKTQQNKIIEEETRNKDWEE